MRVRTLATTAVVAALGLTSFVPADAAKRPALPKALVVKDLAGDANALNDQGFGAPVPDTAGPADAAPFDIRNVTIVTDKAGTAATRITATLELGAAPSPDGVYRVLSNLGGACFWFQATFLGGVADLSSIRVCGSGGGVNDFTDTDVPVKVDGTKLIWSVPLKSFKSAGLKPGAVLDGIGAESRLSQYAITAPRMDGLVSDAVYKVGQ